MEVVQTEETVEGTEEITEVETTEENPQETDESPQESTEEVKFANTNEYEKAIYSEVQSRTHKLQAEANDLKKKVRELQKQVSEKDDDKMIASLLSEDEPDTDETKQKEANLKKLREAHREYQANSQMVNEAATLFDNDGIAPAVIEDYGLDDPDPATKVNNYRTLIKDVFSEMEWNRAFRDIIEVVFKDGQKSKKEIEDYVAQVLEYEGPKGRADKIKEIGSKFKLTPKVAPEPPESTKSTEVSDEVMRERYRANPNDLEAYNYMKEREAKRLVK